MVDADELKRHPSIIHLYTNYVRLKRNGKEMGGLCPLHPDKDTPSFKVRQAQDGTYLWNCFGCDQKGGNIFQFLQKKNQISFNQAVEIVREFVGDSFEKTKVAERTFQSVTKEPETLRTFSLEEYAKYEKALKNNQVARDWLQRARGIGVETAERLHLGYRHDLGRIAGPDSPIADKGWIVHPVIEKGVVVGMEYRSIVEKQFRKQPGMKSGLFNTAVVDSLVPIFLTEGVYDAASLEQAGFSAVSTPNAQYTLTPSDRDLLLSAECLILAGDNDDAGRKAMDKLFREMKERTYWLRWPDGIKDANDLFKSLKFDVSAFRTKVNELAEVARSKPMSGVYDVRQSLLTANHSSSIDHPDRWRFPWKSVDDMAVILPGDVVSLYSTDSGMGKTSLILQASLFAAMKHNKVILNYQAEMMPQQIDTIITSHLLKKDRLTLGQDDYRMAGQSLPASMKYYIGRDTSLTNISQVLDLIEAGIRRFGPDGIILDNLHFLCRNENDPIKAQSNASQRIKNLAGEYGVVWFNVHQARKADQNHKRKVTHISDMDGSKAIQNDSSVVFSVHREEVKHARDEESGSHEYDPITEIRLQKVREKGPGKSFTQLLFVGGISTFSEVAKVEEPDLFGGGQ